MEAHYNVMLFERLGKKLFLTAAGQELLHYARHIVSLAAQTEKNLRDFAQAAPLRLGATLSIGESLFIEILRKLKSASPERRIFSKIHNTATLEQCLLRDELDAALVEGTITSTYLMQLPIWEDELVFIISPELLPLKGFTPQELCQQPFILREEGSGTRNLFEQTMNKATASLHLTYSVTGSYNNTESIKQAVAAGLGISVLSSRLISRELADGTLTTFKIPGLTFRRSFRIVYHKNKFLSPGLKEFISLCTAMGNEQMP